MPARKKKQTVKQKKETKLKRILDIDWTAVENVLLSNGVVDWRITITSSTQPFESPQKRPSLVISRQICDGTTTINTKRDSSCIPIHLIS